MSYERRSQWLCDWGRNIRASMHKTYNRARNGNKSSITIRNVNTVSTIALADTSLLDTQPSESEILRYKALHYIQNTCQRAQRASNHPIYVCATLSRNQYCKVAAPEIVEIPMVQGQNMSPTNLLRKLSSVTLLLLRKSSELKPIVANLSCPVYSRR